MRSFLLVAVFLVAAGLAAALIAVSATGADDEPAPAAIHDAAAVEELLAGIPQDGNVLGRADAPLTIVEYADYQCPYCALWATDTLPALVEEYVRPGHARIVFQGIAILGDDSVTALESAVAAGVQDRLWNVSELLFHNQGLEGSGWVTEELLADVGSAVPGLDVDRMVEERGSAQVDDAITAAHAAAAAAGVSSTPTFEVGRTGGPKTLVVGARPTDDFRRLLDGLLDG